MEVWSDAVVVADSVNGTVKAFITTIMTADSVGNGTGDAGI